MVSSIAAFPFAQHLADAHFELGVLYGNRKHYQLASQELETAVCFYPKPQEAHCRLAPAYRKTEQKDLSAKEMQQFEKERKKPANKTSISLFRYLPLLILVEA